MSIFGSLEGMAEQAMNSNNDQTKVAGGFLKAVEEHPGGIGGLLESLRQNGLGDTLKQWTSGQTQPTTPEQVQKGLNGTGLIEKTAEKAGVSQEVVKMALTTILPMVISHFAPGGQPAKPEQFTGLAGQLMSRLL